MEGATSNRTGSFCSQKGAVCARAAPDHPQGTSDSSFLLLRTFHLRARPRQELPGKEGFALAFSSCWGGVKGKGAGDFREVTGTLEPLSGVIIRSARNMINCCTYLSAYRQYQHPLCCQHHSLSDLLFTTYKQGGVFRQ